MVTGTQRAQQELSPSVDTTGREMEDCMPQHPFPLLLISQGPALAKSSPKPEGKSSCEAAHLGQLAGLDHWTEN